MEKKVKMILFMLLGNAILALGTAIFVVPNGLISGGVTGVALILQHFFGISVDIGVYVARCSFVYSGRLVRGKCLCSNHYFQHRGLSDLFCSVWKNSVFDESDR